MTLPTSLRAEPVRARKAALVVTNHARTHAQFLGLSVNLPYDSEDTARCLQERCPVPGEHSVPHPDGSCGFHATSDDPIQWFMPEVALLDVEFFGRLIRHERGVRSSRQRVLGAAFVRGCRECLRVTERPALVAVPAPIFGDRLLVVPRCEHCADVWRTAASGPPLAPAELAGLLGTEVSFAPETESREVLHRASRRTKPSLR